MRLYLTMYLSLSSFLIAFTQMVNIPKVIYVVGNIYDIDSLKSLPSVKISLNNNQYLLSDASGHFNLSVLKSDTVYFLIEGFEPATLTFGDISNSRDTVYIEILMKLKAFDLPEAVIRPFGDYQHFKDALINMDHDYFLTQNAYANMDRVMSNMNVLVKPTMDEYSNFKNMIMMKDKNNNAFIFLSSEPGKGLIGGLNAIGIRLPWQKK